MAKISNSPEWVTAEVLSVVSKLSQQLPILDRITSYVPNKLYVPVRWRHLRRQSAHTMQATKYWPAYQPVDHIESDLPKKFRYVALITGERHGINALQAEFSGSQAVAYLLGHNQIMVGYRTDGKPLFDIKADAEDFYQLGMRLGNGVLRASLGVMRPDGLFMNRPGDDSRSVLPIEQTINHFV